MMNHPDTHPRLLIADDDPELGALLSEFLSEEGYEVTLATTLDEALTLADERLFDLALTDVFIHEREQALPSLVPLLAAIRPTPIGVITGWPLMEEAALGEGFTFLLAKPFDMGELLTTITTHLQRAPAPEQRRRMEIVERYCAAFNAHDLDACLALCTEDIVFYPPTQSSFAQQSSVHGRAAFRKHLEDVWWRFPDFRFDERQFYSHSNGVALRFRENWINAHEADGRAHMAATMLFDFAGDHICQIAAHLNASRWSQLLTR